MVKITQEDRQWLHTKHRGMVVDPSCDAVEGIFRVRGLLQGHRKVSDCPGIPDQSLRNERNFAEDKFRIHASFAEDRLPQVKEIGGRFQERAQKMRDETGKPIEECLWDLHIYGDGVLCLGHDTTLRVALARNRGIQGFFEHLLMPYFFFHAYLDKNGTPPWPGLSHDGRLATLEEIFYVRGDRELLAAHLCEASKMPEIAWAWMRPTILCCSPGCLCSSGKLMQECHPEAYKGAVILCRAMAGGGPPFRR